MARRSRKRAINEQLDGSPNHQEAQEQPTVVNAEKPQLLCTATEATLPKEPEIKMAEEEEVKKVEGVERNEPNQFRNEPDSTPAKETMTKSVIDLDSKHREWYPKLDPLSPKDSNSVLLPEPEQVVVKNDANGLSTEPDSTTPRKKKKKRKGKSLSTRGVEETNDAQSEHRESIPNLDPLSPKESDPVLLPESQPVAEKNAANKLCAEPESATPRKKRKRKDKSLSMSEGIEKNDVHSEHRESIPNLDPLSPKESDPVLLPESQPIAEKNGANKLCAEPESATPTKKRKMKDKSLSMGEGIETNDVHSEHREFIPDLDPLLLKDSNFVLLPGPRTFSEKNNTNPLGTEPESATARKKKRKGKRKSLSNSEGVEVNHVNSERHELCPNLAKIPPKDTDPLLLPEPAPVGEKNGANQLCPKPDSTSPKFEGEEIKVMDSGSVPPKDSNIVLVHEPESFAGKSDTNQLCTEPESVTPRKKRKGKRKSLSNIDGVEVNHVNSEDFELCPNLASLPPKDTDPLLLPEPASVREKNEANQLCTKPDSTFPKFEGAEITDMDSCSVHPKDSNLVLLPEPESFAGKSDTNQLCTEPESVTPMKKKRKGKRKILSNSEGVEVNHVNSERHELCPNLAEIPPKDTDPLLFPELAPIREKNEAHKLCTKPDSTSPKFDRAEIKDVDSGSLPPKDSNLVLLLESESFAGKSDADQLCTEPELVTPRRKKRKGKRKSLSNSDGVEVNRVNSEVFQLCPNLASLPPKNPEPLLLPEPAPVREKNEANQLCTKPDSTSPKFEGAEIKDMDSGSVHPKDSNLVLLPEPESFAGKSDTNQLCTEPESVTPMKKKRKGKRKILSNSEGVEVNHVNSERHELCPNLAEIPPKDTDPLLFPELAPIREKNEAHKLCTKPDSTSPKFDRAEIKDVDSGSLPPKDSNLVLLLESESFAGKSDADQLCTEPELVTPRRKKRKGKRKSLSNSDGVEVNRVNSEVFQLCPNLASLPPKNPEPLLLPEPAPVREKNEANQLCTKPDSTSPKFEGAEIKDMDSGSVHPKESNFVLLPESESFAGKNDTNQLCTEPESVTPRKKKRKGKRKSLSNSKGVEVNHVNSERHELCPNLAAIPPKDHPLLLPEPAPVGVKNKANQLRTKPDSTSPKFEGAEIKDMDSGSVPPKDSNFVLLPESESFAGKNNTNQLFTEPESVTPRKKKRKGKRKSLSNSEGVEVNCVDSGHRELCLNLAALSPKAPDPLLLPEPDSTSSKFEGAEIKDMDSDNLELCPKLDPLPPKDSDLLLPESDPAPLKGVDQEKKRKNKKKKKNKGKLEGEGVESNRPSDEHSQQCHKAKPTTAEEQNQRKRKRLAMNETQNSSIWSMGTPNYDFGPRGVSILIGEAVSTGPWIPKMPLKNYERYQRCLECGQICQSDQTCRGLRRLPNKNTQICFFCGTPGHLIGRCPMSPGAKCSKGIIMLDDYVRNKCSKEYAVTANFPTYEPIYTVNPVNVPTYAPTYTPFWPSNIHPYPAPFVRTTYAPFEVWRN